MKFTALTVKQLPPQEKRYIVYETNGKGFAVRVSPNGAASYLLIYRYGKRLRYYTLGKTNEITLKEAHKRAESARQLLEKGQDPAEEKRLSAIRNLADPTMSALMAEYLEKWAKPRKRSWQEDARIFNYDLLPMWGKRKASSILRREVISLLEGIVERGSPIAANRTLALIRRLFNFAIERDILEHTPCLGVKAPSKETQRDRVLTESEIQTLWHALEHAHMSTPVQLLLKLMLVTAQRKGEWVQARWQDIDLLSRCWLVPNESVKNGRTHHVYLSDMAIALLERLKKETPGSPWLFPSARNIEKHLTPECVSRAIQRSRQDCGDIQPFCAHDLRRTAASYMTGIGISRLVVSKILNHADRGVTAIYDRHTYRAEKQAALAQWAEHLTHLITKLDSNILSFKKAIG